MFRCYMRFLDGQTQDAHEFEQTPADSGGQRKKPGVLKSTESQRLEHNLATEQQQLYRKYFKT